jgi:phage replication initiation protein
VTRPSKSALVLDGSEIKVRLEAERAASKTPVHVDWVRFTTLLRNNPTPSVDLLFPPAAASIWDDNFRQQQIARILAELPDEAFGAAAQARDLATEVAGVLGTDYAVAVDMRKGHDFYRYRWAIERNGVECGWVGFLSSSDSPRQQAQAKTLHVNLFGAACTFAAHGWNHRLADLIEQRDGDLTRCDLALDFFDGLPGGLDSIVEDYKSGACDSGGKRLKSNCVGDWLNGRERSLYFGSKEAGKQTNAYEKGHQLFGAESGSEWLRIELRYGNKLRVLGADMLRRPADFFAGASDWHALMLAKADAIVTPQPVATTPRLALETVQAEVSRVVRWAYHTAAPTIAAAFHYMGDEFLDLVTGTKLPGRLQKFSKAEISKAFASVCHSVSPVEGACHALA